MLSKSMRINCANASSNAAPWSKFTPFAALAISSPTEDSDPGRGRFVGLILSESRT